MDSYNRLFDIFILLIGIYMLYGGFSGKVTLYKTEYIKTGMEEKYKKLIKWFCFFGGSLAIIWALLDYFKIEPIATVLFVILCVLVVLVTIVIIRFTDSKKARNHK